MMAVWGSVHLAWVLCSLPWFFVQCLLHLLILLLPVLLLFMFFMTARVMVSVSTHASAIFFLLIMSVYKYLLSYFSWFHFWNHVMLLALANITLMVGVNVSLLHACIMLLYTWYTTLYIHGAHNWVCHSGIYKKMISHWYDVYDQLNIYIYVFIHTYTLRWMYMHTDGLHISSTYKIDTGDHLCVIIGIRDGLYSKLTWGIYSTQ